MTRLLPGERIDDLQRSSLHIIQNPEKFCFGMDAVLLSGFVRIKPQECVTDLCSGSGIIPLLLSAKTRAGSITAVEIQPDMADMAERSVELNGLEERIRVICADLRDGRSAGRSGTQDVVTCNPPYMAAGEGIPNPESAVAIARHELCCTLEDVVRESARLLRNGGRVSFVYRPHRLAELMTLLRSYGLAPKRMKLVYPYVHREANMVLLEASKGGGSFLKVEAPIIVFREPGVYTDEIREIYGY